MKERFGNTQLLVAKLINLVPAIIRQQNDLYFDEVVSFYSKDLPNPALVPTHMWRWREKWSGLIAADLPATLQSALKSCDKEYFPNLHVFVRIAIARCL